jgi:stearoyl-CoA desaturase (Delta-9 desaturase)
MLKNLNYIGVLALVAYPLFLFYLGYLYFLDHPVGLFELLLFLVGYYVSNLSVGLGLHRLWSHDSYKTNKYVEFILAIFSAGTLQGPALSWASNHFDHHTYTDTDKDPHTPKKYKSKIKGFLWSHIGWMLSGEGSYRSINRVTMVKLGRNKILRWQLKHYWKIVIVMNLLVPALVGFVFGGTMLSAYAGFVFIGVGRALQQQATFFVNSLCHFVGTQKYTSGTSRDVWWLAFLLLGENWHNFHHAFPSDYRNGAKWYHADIHKWIIYLMSKCGLAWDLKKTENVRITAKVNQTFFQLNHLKKEQMTIIQQKLNELGSVCSEKFLELEGASHEVKRRFLKSLSLIQNKIDNLKTQLNESMKDYENSSDKIIKSLEKKMQKAEIIMQNIYLEMELALKQKKAL